MAKSGWADELSRLGPLILEIGVGLGFAIYILASLAGGLTGSASNAINTIITGVSTELVTFWPIIVIALFIGATYFILRWSKIIK